MIMYIYTVAVKKMSGNKQKSSPLVVYQDLYFIHDHVYIYSSCEKNVSQIIHSSRL